MKSELTFYIIAGFVLGLLATVLLYNYESRKDLGCYQPTHQATREQTEVCEGGHYVGRLY